jgi:aminoglycoside phosphotransferase family enzyme/predicted kinase
LPALTCVKAPWPPAVDRGAMRNAESSARLAPRLGAAPRAARRDHREPELIRALQRAVAYPHPVTDICLVQTHISWVLLTGAFAYKIKKPVDLGFLDFSSLARRRAACEEELRLNRRWAPELYLDVVAIAGTRHGPRVGGAGHALEYAVRMRQFAQEQRLDRRLAAGQLGATELAEFAETLARAHAQAPVAHADGAFGTPAAVRAPVAATLAALLDRAGDSAEAGRIKRLRDWVEWSPGDAALRTRLRDGRVREGHGDLHLGNLVRWRDRVCAFDCLEFDPALRWIDVMSDVAFLVMDLSHRGREDLAHVFLSRYLEVSGDYAGLAVLRAYVVHRALVRAKIAAIRRDGPGAVAADDTSVRRHLELALRWTHVPRPLLVLMHGLSGSGKTHISGALVGALPAVRVRSDLERRRGGPPVTGRYEAAAIAANYARLAELARASLAAGLNTIVDATFLAREQRERFAALARRLGAPCVIVDCRAPRAVLERRLRERARAGDDASEADAGVLAHQLAAAEPLGAEPGAEPGAQPGVGVVTVGNTTGVDARALACAVRARAGLPA